MMHSIATALVVWATIMSFGMTIVYGFWAKWWLTPIGQAIIFQSSTYTLILGYVAWFRLTHSAPEAVDGQVIVAVVIYGFIAAVKTYLFYTFTETVVRERRQRHGADRNKSDVGKHRLSRGEPGDSPTERIDS